MRGEAGGTGAGPRHGVTEGAELISTEEALSRRPLDAHERVAYGTGSRCFADLRLPTTGAGADRSASAPWPVAVVVHGGCWREGADLHYMDGLAAALNRLGWATWSVEFRVLERKAGAGSGVDPARAGAAGQGLEAADRGTLRDGWPELFLDVARATDHLREAARRVPLDLGTVVSVGHSSGGHLALWLAARPRLPDGPLSDPDPLRIRGAVGLGAIPDLAAFDALPRRACDDAVRQLLGGAPEHRPDRLRSASPAELLPLGVPQLLVTGALDPDVPPSFVDSYARRARGTGDDVYHRIVEGAGHFEVVAPWSARWPAVRDTLAAFLEERSGGP